MLVLDSGAMTLLGERSGRAAALIAALTEARLWPPVVPSILVVESVTGAGAGNLADSRFLRTCDIVDTISLSVARRAAWLRIRAQTGSAADALVIAIAEPGGTVLAAHLTRMRKLAAYARDVIVEPL
jgi:hypothetical protein